MIRTDMYEGLLAETITLPGSQRRRINAYFARPLGPGPFPGWCWSITCPAGTSGTGRPPASFAHHGYLALCPNLYYRAGHGTPEDVAAKVRGVGRRARRPGGGRPGRGGLLRSSLPYSNGKVGVFGTCSGGRHAYLAACRVPGLRRSRRLLGRAGGDERRRSSPPNSPSRRWITPRTWRARCSACSAWTTSAHPGAGGSARAGAETPGKAYEFHMYPGAGHGFFYHHRPNYRQEQAVDGWAGCLLFSRSI